MNRRARRTPGILITALSLAVLASGEVAAQSDSVSAPLVCLVVDGELAEVSAQIASQSGDTLVDGRTLAQVLEDTPSPYLATAEWSLEGTVTFNGRRLAHYGVPRVLAPSELMRVGEYQGVPIFAERDDEPDEYGRIIIFYLPIRPGCEFQVFLDGANVGAVRGRR